MENRRLYPLALYLAHAVRDEELRAAAQARLVPRQPASSVRRSVGQSLVRLGEHLVGEPPAEPVRSR
jgi:hypothetical protein